MRQPRITVVGSINMDLVTSTDIFPQQGETVRGEDFHTNPGGKGANQAVAAARLGADVHMVGRVGDDTFGENLLHNLQQENIDTSMVDQVANTSSGLANITLSEKDNRIIIIPGANNQVTPEYVKACEETILASDYVLLQFEIPKETIEYCIDVCAQHDIPVVVNPAPVMPLSPDQWEKASVITPNETEAAELFKGRYDEIQEKLVITKGKEGVEFFDHGTQKNVSPYKVEVADTTGAGDTFNGALAVALAEGQTLTAAVQFANAAGALSVQKLGAQGGMPTRQAVDQMLEER
ncbi:ribokinase [Gracilibacillus halophilus YIM-C55.5]|uniref:Ribokinase n=1 Tax=Gracilibacillus halophilus YIM-C55.5 TaxID=1308866 RepID=N4WRG7_9BACI|nr:ribokinase [Gracilibacillus halophilus]ENH95811.1 ribokinase [Gracilibacillus halophilus YIM-C55.5]